LALLIATFFYAGYFPKAPGTIGSLLTALLWVGPIYWGVSPWIRFSAAALIFLIGLWASEHARRYLGGDDPQIIVIDEVAGQTLALAICAAHPISLIAAFALFRFFDVLKPGPIGWMDRNVKGGLGIMVDDMAAGAVALALIACAQFAWPQWF
jgi:phosphatidylglycerophosphatase A